MNVATNLKLIEPACMRNYENVLYRVNNRTAHVAIIGLGYVGLPLALTTVRSGFTVTGIDISQTRVATISDGRSGLNHIPDAEVEHALNTSRFFVTNDPTRLIEADAIIVCVPTPLGRNHEPDLSWVTNSVRAVATQLQPGQLVVVESTTYPGTTDQIVKPILETSGLRSGEDFYLAFSPEREDPGNANFNTRNIPKVVGGDTERCQELACALYKHIISSVVPVSCTRVAEAVKITENVFRAVNIALVNELKMIYAAMDIDIWEVIEAAKTKPFGFMAFYPGPGLGGHCIPIDPFYLTWKAREFEVPTRFIELAGEINTFMPHYVVDRLARALDEREGCGLRGARILVLGIAYKKNIEDTRESPSFRLMELLEARGAVVSYHDPHVPVIPPTREHPALAGRCSVALDPATLAACDAALIATDHD